MKVAVIIATAGRKVLVNHLLALLEQQTRLPDEIIISAPDESHVLPYAADRLKVSYLYGSRGLAAQRNRALDHARQRFDVITYFDDDFLPGANYIRDIEQGFETHPDWMVITGNVIADGIKGPGFSFEEGLSHLQSAETIVRRSQQARDIFGAYGCNMSIRTSAIGARRFDERLVLYGWQEDIDFTSQLAAQGKIVSFDLPIGVHLGIKSGRVSGVRLGYSQLVNPIYLIRKGTLPVGRGLKLVARNVASNLAKSLWSEPYIDRRGRLKGNAIAALHLFMGRIEPEYVLKL